MFFFRFLCSFLGCFLRPILLLDFPDLPPSVPFTPFPNLFNPELILRRRQRRTASCSTATSTCRNTCWRKNRKAPSLSFTSSDSHSINQGCDGNGVLQNCYCFKWQIFFLFFCLSVFLCYYLCIYFLIVLCVCLSVCLPICLFVLIILYLFVNRFAPMESLSLMEHIL